MNEELRNEIKGTVLESVDRNDLEYNIPDSFFANLSEEVIKSAKAQSPPSHAHSWQKRIRDLNFYAIAASIVLIVGTFFAYNVNDDGADDNIFRDAESLDLIEYANLELDVDDVASLELENMGDLTSLADIDNEILHEYLEEQSETIELIELIDYL